MIDHRIKQPLFYSVQHGYVAVTKELMTRGASVNCTDNRKKTPLHQATEDGKKLITLKPGVGRIQQHDEVGSCRYCPVSSPLTQPLVTDS
jgi:hypothetical protein